MSASNRTPVVVGNWKLHKTVAEGTALCTELGKQLGNVRDVEVGVAPVFVSLAPLAAQLESGGLQLFGQNCHWEEKGAWTGEVGPALLKDVGCHGCIVGHSERRQHFGESDEVIGKKARAVLDAGLRLILCVGETEAERDGGKTAARVSAQLAGGLARVEAGHLSQLIIAYEPVWAIGTGRTATPAQAQEVHAQIRGELGQRYGKGGTEVRIQYGGSVKPDNAESLMSQPDIDGALVGGASLKADEFVAIVNAARLAKGR